MEEVTNLDSNEVTREISMLITFSLRHLQFAKVCAPKSQFDRN